MKTLIIIDMQYEFRSAHCDKTQNNIIRLIKFFSKKNWPIVFVVYEGESPIVYPIRKHLKKLKNIFFVEKYKDDGSKEILECLRQHNLPNQNLIVCGVNTDYCVYDTCQGLLKQYPTPTVRVIKSACNSNQWGRKHFDAWKKYVSTPFFNTNLIINGVSRKYNLG